MKNFLGKPGKLLGRHIVRTIKKAEVLLQIALRLLFVLALLIITGCKANAVEASIPLDVTSSPTVKSPATTVPISPTRGSIPSPSMAADTGLQNLIDKARMDLAQQLSIPMTQINVIQAISAIWPDSGLGCPQPGMAYSQVLTSGYLIQLQADNRVYEYHTDDDQLVVFCGTNTMEYQVKPGDIKDDKPWMPP